MELELVRSDDMCEEGEDHTTNIEEFVVNRDIQSTLCEVYGLTIERLKNEGYKDFLLAHARYGRDVVHLAKGNTVMIADYRGANLLTLEVLPKNEVDQFVRNIKETFGPEYLGE